MTKVITGDFFVGFVLPIITTGLSVFFKMTSRNDAYSSFRKEDLAVGIETSITALLLLATDTVNKLAKFNEYRTRDSSSELPEAVKRSTDSLATIDPKLLVQEHNIAMEMSENLQIAPLLIVGLVVGLVLMTFLIRKLGWKAAEEMTLFWGIILPNIFGLLSLLLVVLWIR